jgi:hypothetical protein
MLAGFVFALALPELLLDLFADKIYRRIQISFHILGEKIRTRHRNAHRTGKLPLEGFRLVMFHDYSNAGGKGIEVFEFFDFARQMVVNGFGQRDVVSRKNHIHRDSMRSVWKKSTWKLRRLFRPGKSPGIVLYQKETR